jgi:hypothetical protein
VFVCDRRPGGGLRPGESYVDGMNRLMNTVRIPDNLNRVRACVRACVRS